MRPPARLSKIRGDPIDCSTAWRRDRRVDEDDESDDDDAASVADSVAESVSEFAAEPAGTSSDAGGHVRKRPAPKRMVPRVAR